MSLVRLSLSVTRIPSCTVSFNASVAAFFNSASFFLSMVEIGCAADPTLACARPRASRSALAASVCNLRRSSVVFLTLSRLSIYFALATASAPCNASNKEYCKSLADFAASVSAFSKS